jgi:hypothetical protein
MSVERVRELAKGQVYTGRQAKEVRCSLCLLFAGDCFECRRLRLRSLHPPA